MQHVIRVGKWTNMKRNTYLKLFPLVAYGSMAITQQTLPESLEFPMVRSPDFEARYRGDDMTHLFEQGRLAYEAGVGPCYLCAHGCCVPTCGLSWLLFWCILAPKGMNCCLPCTGETRFATSDRLSRQNIVYGASS